MRKQEAIDLLRLYSEYTKEQWNAWLSESLEKENIEDLTKTLYAIQAGMDNLVKQKLTGEKLALWFVRLCRSIENTIIQIIKKRMPNPLDNPKALLCDNDKLQALAKKRERDQEIEKYLKKVRY